MFVRRHRFKVCTSARYLGVCIEDKEPKHDWLRECTLMWEKTINTIIKTAGKYSQESYDAVVRAIRSEWIFLQRVTWDTWDAFAGVEKLFGKPFCLVFSSEIRKPSHSLK